MKNFAAKLLLTFLFLAPVAALAQSSGKVVTDCTTGVPLAYPVGSNSVPAILPTGKACVDAAVSVAGFAPATTGTPISVTTGGVTGTLPAGAVVVATNVGTTQGAYCKLGASATTSDQFISPNGGWFAFTVGAATQLTCITSTGTTTVNMVGGSGVATGTGGGGGGSGGGAVTVADGADVAEGAIADASVTAGATGTISAKLRRISADIDSVKTNTAASIPAGTALIGDVNLRQGGTALSATNGIFSNLLVGNAAVATGTGAQGATSPRMTVATDQATNAGAALKNGGVGVVNGASAWETVAASQTGQVLGATGAAGDYLSHCMVYPTTTTPGVVTVFDDTSTAANNVIAFPGGASSVSNLVPFAFPVGAVSVTGAWKVTTGANLVVTCYGKFT